MEETAASARPPIRVALLATSTAFGGIERVLLNLVQHMPPGIELCPIVFTRTDTTETSFVDRLQALGVTPEKLYVNSHSPALIVNPIVNFKQAVAIFRSRRFDLIHSHGYRADTFGLALSKWCGVPAVSTCHGFVTIDSRLRFYNALDVRLLKSFARVIAVSVEMKNDLLKKGLRDDVVDVVTNAVPEASPAEHLKDRHDMRARLGIADGEFVFGYVGRVSEEKGVVYLLRAAAKFRESNGAFRVIVVGDGPARSGLEHMTRELGLDDRVIFAGFQRDTEPWLAAMDSFVLPSLTEGTPMALLEAMAASVPVVASAVGGVPAVVRNRENGLLVPAADVPRLAEAMRELATSPSLRQTLSQAGLETVRERYGVQDWVCRVRSVYMKALQQRAGSPQHEASK